jgi:hypothetical protein
MTTADSPQLVATEFAQHGGESPGHLSCELADEALLAAGNVVDLAAEEAAEVEKAGARQHADDRVDARRAAHGERGGRRPGSRGLRRGDLDLLGRPLP